MTVPFDFETSLGETLSAELSVWAHSNDGDYGFEDLSLMRSDGTLVDEESLLPQDRVRLEQRCETVAYDNSCEAFQRYCEGRADALYDSWKDGE